MEKIIVKPKWKTSIDDVGDYIQKVNRGGSVIPDKKKSSKCFRREKHKKNFQKGRDY